MFPAFEPADPLADSSAAVAPKGLTGGISTSKVKLVTSDSNQGMFAAFVPAVPLADSSAVVAPKGLTGGISASKVELVTLDSNQGMFPALVPADPPPCAPSRSVCISSLLSSLCSSVSEPQACSVAGSEVFPVYKSIFSILNHE